MTKFEWQRIKEIILYILNITKGLDYYRVFKVLYFAEKEHLKKYGTRMIADSFCALPYGPVPENLYQSIKGRNLPPYLSDAIKFAGEDASTVLLPLRACDLDYLSKSDIECLNNSIQENVSLTFNQLKEKSHDYAWNSTPKLKEISRVDMAKAAGATDAVIEYILEQEQIDELLR